jgi:hypothetical protein
MAVVLAKPNKKGAMTAVHLVQRIRLLNHLLSWCFTKWDFLSPNALTLLLPLQYYKPSLKKLCPSCLSSQKPSISIHSGKHP